MGNNYTSIPNIIPGNLTVTGNLSVLGNQMLLGSTSPYIRITKNGATTGSFTVNLQPDLVTRDDPTRFGYGEVYDCQTPQLYRRMVNAAGVMQLAALRLVIGAVAYPQTANGSGGDFQFVTKAVNGKVIDKNGVMVLRIWGNHATVASGGITLAASLGGIAGPAANIAASVTGCFDVSFFFANANSYTNQLPYTFAYGTGVSSPTVGFNVNIDTTVAETLVAKAHFLQPTDNIFVAGYEVALLNSFGPL